MSELQQFLYVLVKENYTEGGKVKIDTVLRIVYWEANEELDYDSHFVIYGKRPKSKITGKHTPYRLKCYTQDQVHKLVRTLVGSEHNVAIELHQFYGYSDDSEDWYNIDWKNTPNDGSTELVAFDTTPTKMIDGTYFLDFGAALSKVLDVIENNEVV